MKKTKPIKYPIRKMSKEERERNFQKLIKQCTN